MRSHGSGASVAGMVTLTVSPAFGSGQSLGITFPDWCSSEGARLGVLVYTARMLDVPEVCIVLTWSSAVAATYVICVHSPGVDWLEAHAASDLTCDTCGDPCDDADLCPEQGPTGNARDMNCVRCQPCSLCVRCSVRLGLDQVCLECITEEEAAGLASSKHRRWKLLGDLSTERFARFP